PQHGPRQPERLTRHLVAFLVLSVDLERPADGPQVLGRTAIGVPLLLRRFFNGAGLRLQADTHDLVAALRDRDQFLSHDLAVLDHVTARLEADLFGPRAGDDDIRSVYPDADAGVIDLDDQRALRRKQPNDRAADMSDAGRFREAEAAQKRQKHDCGGRPEAD